MIYKSVDHQSDSVTQLKDKLAWENSLKVTLLGHRKFVSQKALLLNKNYRLFKDALKQETLLLK